MDYYWRGCDENLISLSKVFAGAANRRENVGRAKNIFIELAVMINQYGGNIFTERNCFIDFTRAKFIELAIVAIN